MSVVGMMPLCFEIPLPDLQVALTGFNHLILLIEMKSAEVEASGFCCLQPLGCVQSPEQEMQKPSGGWAGAVVTNPMVVLVQKIVLNYSISWKSSHPHPHISAHPHSTTTLEQRSTPRRKMQLQLFACCLSGLGLKVLKTYICVSLDVL